MIEVMIDRAGPIILRKKIANKSSAYQISVFPDEVDDLITALREAKVVSVSVRRKFLQKKLEETAAELKTMENQ